jgi:transposase
MTDKKKKNPEQVVREIKRKTRRRFTSDEKIRIVLEGLKGEESIAAICRKEGISPNLYYTWSKSFLEAGKKCLSGDTQREATSDEVTILKRENEDLKRVLAETFLRYEQIKKNRNGLL